MSRGVSIVTIAVVVLIILAFHFVTYGTGRGRRFCVVPKGHLTFESTFENGHSEVAFALEHPYIYARINNGHGVCLSY